MVAPYQHGKREEDPFMKEMPIFCVMLQFTLGLFTLAYGLIPVLICIALLKFILGY